MPANYMPGLHALRGYAALSVVVWHVWKHGVGWFRLPGDEPLISHFFLTGTDAVTLFYVLSGFLLTFLLLGERTRNGVINTRAFYGRRARRILPLYYLVLLVSAVFGLAWADAFPTVFSVFQHPDKVAAVLVLIPNVAFSVVGLAALSHFWSIGVEWQFYLLVPRLLSARRVPLALAGVIVARAVLLALLSGTGDFYKIVLHLKIDAMAIGGLFAWAWYTQAQTLRLLLARSTRWFTGLMLVVLIVVETPIHNPLFDYAAAVLFGLLVLNVVAGRWVVENRVTRWLGDVSYGVYLWHILVLFFMAAVGLRGPALYASVVVISLLIASVSYRYVERPVLRWKGIRGVALRHPTLTTQTALRPVQSQGDGV